MSSIGFSGLGSGLPIDDIIKATIAAEAVPLKRMQADKTFAQEQISAYGSLTSRLESLRSAMSKLKGEDKFELVAAKSSNETAFTATADHRLGATAGNYSVEVIRKAESYRWVSESMNSSQVFSGQLSIDGITLDVGTPELDGNGDPTGVITPWTLDELRQAINDNADLKNKVSANIVNEGGGQSRLVLNSKTSGEAGRLNIYFGSSGLTADTSLSQSNVDIGGTTYTHTRSSAFASVDPAVDTLQAGATVKLSSFSGTGNLPAFDVDVSGMTLDEAADAINSRITTDPALADMNGKLEAVVVTDGGQSRLEMRSSGTITNFQLAFEQAGFDPQIIASDAGKSSGAGSLDAEISIDGINATSSTNTFTDVISGVTISLGADATIGQTGTLSVARDDGSIKDRIDEFVKAYNDVVIHLNEARKGPLASEGVVRSVEGILRDTLFTPTGGNGDLQNTLASIGITSFVQSGWEPGEERSSRNGTLEIDRTKLDQMLSEDFEKVAFIFGNEETGYAARFEQAARQLTSDTVIDGQIAKGLISTRRSGLTAQIGRIDDRIAATDMRLELMEARLYKQFNAVDAMTANFNSTGNYIAQQMENLPGYTRK